LSPRRLQAEVFKSLWLDVAVFHDFCELNKL